MSAFKKDRTGAMAAPKTLEAPLARSVPRTEIENSGLFVDGTLRNGGVWRAAAIISRTSSANDRPKTWRWQHSFICVLLMYNVHG